MTIIKVTKDGKFISKKKVDETAVPLTPGTNEPGMIVELATPRATKRVVNVFLLLIALLILTTGMIGGVYLYKYLAHKHKSQHVSIEVNDMPTAMASHRDGPRPGSPQSVSYMMVEDIEILEEEDIERIEVPQFDECRRSIVMHDFHMNYTVIVDLDDNECFLMDLDRTKMRPPKTFAELLAKYSSGYYMPKVDVVRQDYRVVTPKLNELGFAGSPIQSTCLGMDSYMLEKKEPMVVLEIEVEYVKTFGYSNLEQLMKDRIHK